MKTETKLEDTNSRSDKVESSPGKLCTIFRDFSAFFSPCFPKQKRKILFTFYMLWMYEVVMNMRLRCCQVL